MPDYSKPLGDVVKCARKRLDLTQNEVADSIQVDVRTIINIENFKGNPKMEVLYPLIRSLKIDAREIFYPEMQRESPSLCQLRLLVEDCSEEEAAAIIPVLQSVNSMLYYEISNPYDEKHLHRARGNYHGFGLKNVAKCVEKYRGKLDVTKTNGVFRVVAHMNSL